MRCRSRPPSPAAGSSDLEPLRCDHRQCPHRFARRGHPWHARVLPAQAPADRVLRLASSASPSSASKPSTARRSAVNDYVLNGKGNAARCRSAAWASGPGTPRKWSPWSSGCARWNLAHERKVKFYGFDMQGSAAATLHLLGLSRAGRARSRRGVRSATWRRSPATTRSAPSAACPPPCRSTTLAADREGARGVRRRTRALDRADRASSNGTWRGRAPIVAGAICARSKLIDGRPSSR